MKGHQAAKREPIVRTSSALRAVPLRPDSSAAAPVVCGTCGGARLVFRPVRRIRHEVWRTVYHRAWVRDAAGRLHGDEVAEHEREIVVTDVGGIDACPECMARAEVEWRGRR